MSRRALAITACTLLLIALATEIILRTVFGFCDAALCTTHPCYEYSFAPSQHRHRFRHTIHYNSYSQRSDEPDSSKTIVLGLGDSVLNGGAPTDQADIATTLASNDTIQILNISAGSWGPDNCAAYLDTHGTFTASLILLIVTSHDAHDNMDFSPIVGTPAYPDRQYPLAIAELCHRYLLPRLKRTLHINPPKSHNGTDIQKGPAPFNPGFDRIRQIADSLNIPFRIYLHPDIHELRKGSFNTQGREIIDWARSHNIPLTTGISNGETPDHFRDGIHYNREGQRHLARWMQQATAGLHR